MHRKRHALTQYEVARLLGCQSGSKISRYERGERLPSIQTMIAFEIVFHVSWRDVLSGQYNRVYKEVRERALALSREVDARTPWTPALQRKFDLLFAVINSSHVKSDEL
jgi:transcriptional regulator with XRE-family HTH domain